MTGSRGSDPSWVAFGDGHIDYSRYTLRELEEALDGINREKYPRNFANLSAAYLALKATLPPEPPGGEPGDAIEGVRPRHDEHGRYIPNQVPVDERTRLALFSLGLLAYGSVGVWLNDIWIPLRRSSDIHLHDAPAWVMYAAMLCGCLVMLSVVVDHYDRRDNERLYRRFAETFRNFGQLLVFASLAWWFVRSIQA